MILPVLIFQGSERLLLLISNCSKSQNSLVTSENIRETEHSDSNQNLHSSVDSPWVCAFFFLFNSPWVRALLFESCDHGDQLFMIT